MAVREMQFLLVDILLELPVAAQQLPRDDEHQDRDHERDQAGRAGQEHRLRPPAGERRGDGRARADHQRVARDAVDGDRCGRRAGR